MSYTVRRLVHDMRSRDARGTGDNAASQGADYHHIRAFNRLLVLNCVREQGPIARVAIAKRMGLSRTTVSSIIDSLLQEGFVLEGSALHAAPAGGRRAILVHFSADAGSIIGVDVGRTHLTFIATDLSGAISAQRFGPFDTERGPEYCLQQLCDELRAFAHDADLSWDRVVGVGVGIPGPLDVETQLLVSPPRMPGWSGVSVAKSLHEALNVPIYLDNDANMGALGESRYGVGQGIADLAYVKIGTGIGSGLIVNGRIHRGSAGSAGEMGHIIIDEDGPQCDCGNKGCLESLAGARAIVIDARNGTSLHSATSVPNALANRDDADITDVIKAALDGDDACRAALERAGERIGVALSGMINLLNPCAIVLDGGVVRDSLFVTNALTRTAALCSLPAAWKRTRILVGELGNLAIALGAVATVIDAAFAQPTLAQRPGETAFAVPGFDRSQATTSQKSSPPR